MHIQNKISNLEVILSDNWTKHNSAINLYDWFVDRGFDPFFGLGGGAKVRNTLNFSALSARKDAV